MAEIVIIILGAIIILLYLLIKFGIIKRRVIVTIVENLPIGIFRDKNKNYEVENKVYVKEVNKGESALNKNSIEIKNDSEYEGKVKEDKQNRDNLSETQDICEDNEGINKKNIYNNEIVYWTPNGKTYHNSKSCFALSRSKVINEGTVEESEKSALCDLCKDNL